ncbi:MAG: hypothetical protein AAFZ65_13675 [Planctomycetota bacterium]
MEYTIREYREGDMPSLTETFNLVFGTERTEAEWRYIHDQNPAGLRLWVAVTEDGQAVCQYSARPYRHWMDGRERGFAEIIDSFVHPDHRAGLKSPGLFIRTALPFFPAYGSAEPPGDAVHYGWPVEQAYRIGQLYLHYNVFRSQTVLGRPVPAGSDQLPDGVRVLERFDASVDRLYARCRDGWGTSVIRDAAFLNWRFADNLLHDYTVLAVDGSDGLAGYLVFRAADWLTPGTGVLADWLVDADDPAAAELLREALFAQARRAGKVAVAGFLPEWSAWFERFQTWGFGVFPTEYYMVGRTFDPNHSLWWLRDHWWFTLADSDLV